MNNSKKQFVVHGSFASLFIYQLIINKLKKQPCKLKLVLKAAVSWKFYNIHSKLGELGVPNFVLK